MREAAPVIVVDLFPPERQELLLLLSELKDEEWHKPTICPGWNVKDIVLHLLGDDVGRLSRNRDAFDDSILMNTYHSQLGKDSTQSLSHSYAYSFTFATTLPFDTRRLLLAVLSYICGEPQ